MKTCTFIKYILVSFLISALFMPDAFAKPNGNKGKGKGKGHKQHAAAAKGKPAQVTQVRVVQKTIVKRQAVPQNINTWTSVNAPIYSYGCPFSCATEGINKSHCRDWRDGNVCFVQDTSLNTYDYSLDRVLGVPNDSPGEIIGRKIDQTVANALR